MISLDKQYRTRDGREVRIYATDGMYGTVHGAVLEKDGWRSVSWYKDGLWSNSHTDHDLIEARPRIQRTMWLNVYAEIYPGHFCISKEEADFAAGKGRLACVKVEIDCEHGEGL